MNDGFSQTKYAVLKKSVWLKPSFLITQSFYPPAKAAGN
jgi:hypothetical protein